MEFILVEKLGDLGDLYETQDAEGHPVFAVCKTQPWCWDDALWYGSAERAVELAAWRRAKTQEPR